MLLRSRFSTKASRAFQACNVYISEGRDRELIKTLEDVAEHRKDAVLVNTFVDEPYNRTGFTIVAADVEALASAAAELATSALHALNLERHAASHPRLGVVDHISCHPVTAAAGLQQTASLAAKLGKKLGSGRDALPVFMYGKASEGSREATLAGLRRRLGFFKGSDAGNWKGNLLTRLPEGVRPDYGPTAVAPRAGVVLVGATRWVTNFNVPLETHDVRTAREIARGVSERGGGVRGVEAMALPHGSGVEVACNLLAEEEDLMPSVLEKVHSLSRERDIAVGNAYRIGRSPTEYAEMASKKLLECTA